MYEKISMKMRKLETQIGETSAYIGHIKPQDWIKQLMLSHLPFYYPAAVKVDQVH